MRFQLFHFVLQASTPLSTVILIQPGPAFANLLDKRAEFTFCSGTGICTITKQVGVVIWPTDAYLLTTFTDAEAYSAFQDSISNEFATATDSDSTFEITPNVAPPTTVLETAEGAYTTVTCCEPLSVYRYGVFDGCEDDDRKTFVTAVPSGKSQDELDDEVLGENSCRTVTESSLAAPPKTKTYYPFLVEPSEAQGAPAAPGPTDSNESRESPEAPEPPTPVNGPLFTGSRPTNALEEGENGIPSGVDNGPVETQGPSDNSGGGEGSGKEGGQGSGGENGGEGNEAGGQGSETGGEGNQAGGEGDQSIPQPPPEANASSPSEPAPTFDAADGASSVYGSSLPWFITVVIGGVLLVNLYDSMFR